MKLSKYMNMYNEIKTANWEPFKIGDIFEIPKIKKYSKIPKENGDIAFISCQSTNNGIASYCNLKPQISHAITVSTNGNNFDCFYHNYKFIPSSDVEILVNSNLNKYNALFICSILNKESKKYSFGKKAKNKAVENTIILLPVDKNKSPDWNYMENYMRERERDHKKTLITFFESSNFYKKSKITLKNIKKFKISDLFDVYRGSRIVKNRDYSELKTKENCYPVITAKTTNNGIDGYYKKYNCEGKIITCGGEASGMFSFYQENKCWVLDRSRILEPKFKINKYIALFLISQLNNYSYLFSYNKSANPKDILPLYVLLPVKKDNNPDWSLIENLMMEKEKFFIRKI